MKRRDFLYASAATGLATTLTAKEKPPLTVGVIGHTGRGDFGHGFDSLWRHFPETQVVAVADPVEKGRAAAITRCPGAKGFADYREMLRESKPAIAAVGTRHVDQHHDMILAAIDEGVRIIYVEKPFCRTLAEADAIVTACQEKGVTLAVAHRNRYHPALPVAKAGLADGWIGTLREIRARGKEDARGGPLDLWVLGSHVLNLVPFFTGKVTACSAQFYHNGKPATKADLRQGDEGTGPMAGDALHARYETESGVPVFFDSVKNAGAADAGFGLQLIGDKGVIDLRMDREPFAHLREGNPNLPTTKATAWVPISSAGMGKAEPLPDLAGQWERHELVVRDLLEAASHKRAPLCSAEDGRDVMELLMAPFASHRRDGARVALPLAERDHPFASW